MVVVVVGGVGVRYTDGVIRGYDWHGGVVVSCVCSGYGVVVGVGGVSGDGKSGGVVGVCGGGGVGGWCG